MAVDLVNDLEVGEFTTRVAMLKYSSPGYVVPEFRFSKHFDKQAIINDIQNAEWYGGWTDTAGALKQAVEEFDDSKQELYGFRPLDEVNGRVTLVFTDGYSQQDPKSAAELVRQLPKMELLATGTDYDYNNAWAGEGTVRVNETQLVDIAGQRDNVFINNAEFRQLKERIRRTYNSNCRFT